MTSQHHSTTTPQHHHEVAPKQISSSRPSQAEISMEKNVWRTIPGGSVIPGSCFWFQKLGTVVFCLNVSKLPQRMGTSPMEIKNWSQKPPKWLPRLARRAMHKSVNRGILELPGLWERWTFDHLNNSEEKRRRRRRRRRDEKGRLFIPTAGANCLFRLEEGRSASFAPRRGSN